jgi:hypothetical protein
MSDYKQKCRWFVGLSVGENNEHEVSSVEYESGTCFVHKTLSAR